MPLNRFTAKLLLKIVSNPVKLNVVLFIVLKYFCYQFNPPVAFSIIAFVSIGVWIIENLTDAKFLLASKYFRL
jgi:hypothetical protein